VVEKETARNNEEVSQLKENKMIYNTLIEIIHNNTFLTYLSIGILYEWILLKPETVWYKRIASVFIWPVAIAYRCGKGISDYFVLKVAKKVMDHLDNDDTYFEHHVSDEPKQPVPHARAYGGPINEAVYPNHIIIPDWTKSVDLNSYSDSTVHYNVSTNPENITGIPPITLDSLEKGKLDIEGYRLTNSYADDPNYLPKSGLYIRCYDAVFRGEKCPKTGQTKLVKTTHTKKDFSLWINTLRNTNSSRYVRLPSNLVYKLLKEY
jgi:hypothetical protein